MGQRRLRYAVGGAPDLLEALCRNASGEEAWKRRPPAELSLLAIALWAACSSQGVRPRVGCQLRGLPAETVKAPMEGYLAAIAAVTAALAIAGLLFWTYW
jgi:hypothetical protein